MDYSIQLAKYVETKTNLVASLLHQTNVLKKMKQDFKVELLEIRKQMGELRISQNVKTRLDFTMLDEEGDCLTDSYVKKCVCLESNIDKVVKLREKKSLLIEKFLDAFENGKQTIKTISLEIAFMNETIDHLKKDEAHENIDKNLKSGFKYLILEGENEYDDALLPLAIFNVQDVNVCLKKEGVELVKDKKTNTKETMWFTKIGSAKVYTLDKTTFIGKVMDFYRLHSGAEVCENQNVLNSEYRTEMYGFRMLSTEMWKKAKLVQRV